MHNLIDLFRPSPRIERKLDDIFKELRKMSAALDRLKTEVAENTSAVDSAIELINGLAQQIRDLAGDPAALAALADELDAKSTALATAVQANTPAEPAQPVVVE